MEDFKKQNTLRTMIYGSLIGDAMGIQFEFYSKSLININELVYKPSHFLNIEAGRWSDDGDNILLVVKTMKETSSNRFDYISYAHKLHYWLNNGFTELGDTTGIGCGNTIYSVITSGNFINDPFSASEKIYNKTKSESNGSIMKIIPISIYYNDLEDVIINTILLCKVTHTSNMVIGCCISANLLTYWATREHYNYRDLNNVMALIERVYMKLEEINLTQKLNLSEEQLLIIKYYMFVEDIKLLNLDEEFKMGYVLKTFGCAFWAFKNISYGFYEILKKIYAEGGDTDTNGCLVGGLVASMLGIDNIPEEWILHLKHKNFIETFCNN